MDYKVIEYSGFCAVLNLLIYENGAKTSSAFSEKHKYNSYMSAVSTQTYSTFSKEDLIALSNNIDALSMINVYFEIGGTVRCMSYLLLKELYDTENDSSLRTFIESLPLAKELILGLIQE